MYVTYQALGVALQASMFLLTLLTFIVAFRHINPKKRLGNFTQLREKDSPYA